MTLSRRQTLIGAAATVAAAALPAVKAVEMTDAEWLASLPQMPAIEATALSEFEMIHNRIMAYQAYYTRIPDDLEILPEIE
jgi:hypothetical protein